MQPELVLSEDMLDAESELLDDDDKLELLLPVSSDELEELLLLELLLLELADDSELELCDELELLLPVTSLELLEVTDDDDVDELDCSNSSKSAAPTANRNVTSRQQVI